MFFFIAILIIPLIIFLIFYPVYLGLITHKDLILKKLAAVDALLINRHMLVSKIIDATEDIMIKETAIIQKVKKLIIDLNKLKMKWNNNEDRFKLENALDVELDIFLTAAMQYPQIKNDIYLDKTINDFILTQTLLINAINDYNITLKNYKVLIDSPPGLILTPILKIKCNFVPYYIPKN